MSMKYIGYGIDIKSIRIELDAVLRHWKNEHCIQFFEEFARLFPGYFQLLFSGME